MEGQDIEAVDGYRRRNRINKTKWRGGINTKETLFRKQGTLSLLPIIKSRL